MAGYETVTTIQKTWLGLLRRVTALGPSWQGTRFESYLAIIDELIELEGRRRTDPDAYRAFRDDLHKQEVLFEGGSQLFQLELAATVWDRLDQNVLADKLEKILAGPVLPEPATLGSDQPRDLLVELLAAAMMADCGFTPTISQNDEDLRASSPGRPDVFVECKRPASENSLPGALKKLRSQAWSRKEKRGATLCMAFIAAERVHNFRGLLKGGTPGEVAIEAERRLDETNNKLRNLAAQTNMGLSPLTPVGVSTISAAVFVKDPVIVYHFVTRLPFDTGPAEATPDWLAERLKSSSGLLSSFVE